MAKGGIKGPPDNNDNDDSNVRGTPGPDLIERTGDDIDYYIQGLAGNDTITTEGGDDSALGGEGDDIISLGDGDDFAQPGSGNDDADGGAGTDKLWYAEFSNGSIITLGAGTEAGTAEVFLDAGHTTSFTDTVTDFEILWATKGDDTITGSSDDEEIHGSFGDDLIDAGAGNDDVEGGLGKDTITGGSGNDTLSGSSDTDTFVFDAGDFANGEHDVIIDFKKGETLILTGFDEEDVIITYENVGGKGKPDTIITLDDGFGHTGMITIWDISLDLSDLGF